jgi:hypothetical protein
LQNRKKFQSTKKKERPQPENCNLLLRKTLLYSKKKMERQELLGGRMKKKSSGFLRLYRGVVPLKGAEKSPELLLQSCWVSGSMS